MKTFILILCTAVVFILTIILGVTVYGAASTALLIFGIIVLLVVPVVFIRGAVKLFAPLDRWDSE